MTFRASIWRNRAVWWPITAFALMAAFVIFVLATGNYLVTALGVAAIYTVFVAGLNLFVGYAGQVSFGQNAFAAIGGYGSAVLTTTYGWEPVAALAASAVIAALVALAVGYPTLRLRGHYLAMATLALGLITYELSVEWQGLTQGYMGITGIPPLGIGSFHATTDREQFAVLATIALVALWSMRRFKYSRLGRALGAVASSEEAARSMAIDVMRYKLIAFVIAAVYGSVAGSLIVHFVGFVSPEVFGLNMVVLGFTMLYIGGIGTVMGPLIGAFAISLLPEALRGFKDYQDIVYGTALILILIYAPKGLATIGIVSARTRRVNGGPESVLPASGTPASERSS